MSVIVKENRPDFPLSINELKEGVLYLSNTGQVVTRLSPHSFKPVDPDYSFVVNIANGIGSYPLNSFVLFRPIINGTIEIHTGNDGRSI